MNICSAYASPEELLVLSSSSDDNEKRRVSSIINTRINKHYTFITHAGLKNQPNLSFTDRIVIIDEVHNLLGNTGYMYIMAAIQRSKNYRLVLLSATPAYDNIRDMFELSNMLNGKANQFQTREALKINGHIDVVKTGIVEDLYKNKIYSLTDSGKKLLLNRMAGKVVYLKVDTSQFPSVRYPGSTKSINSINMSMGVVRCNMEGIQDKYYTQAVEGIKFNPLSGNLEMLSSMIYPDLNGKRIFGIDGMNAYINGNLDTSFLLKQNIKQHSTKLYSLLQNIASTKGKIYIHSSSITNDGVPLIASCLRKNGIDKILVITSDMSADNIAKNIRKFNLPENDDGSKIKILIGSGIIAEGITLKSVRQGHVYEPEWNYSGIDQIIGRIIRRGSHSRLPKEDQTVEIFLYCAVSSNLSRSVDVAKYALATIKDTELKKFERDLAKSAFTCPLFKGRNTVAGTDGSRECDYTTCSYTCNAVGSVSRTDSSTFNLFLHDKETYERVASKIASAFNATKEISITDLVKKSGVDKKIIENIMKYKPPVPVIRKGDIYISKKSPQKVVVGKIPKKTQAVKPRGFVNEKGKFSIEVPKGTKMSSKICETGYDKAELTAILTQLGVTFPAKITKASMCLALQKHLGL